MQDTIELLREFRGNLKSRGKTLHAHVINNAIQFLQRKQRESNEQRVHHPKPVRIPEHKGKAIREKPTRVLPKHAADSATRKQQELTARKDAQAARHAEILRRIQAGEKRYLIAMELQVSEGTVARIAKQHGIPRPSRYTNVRNTTKELTDAPSTDTT